MLTIDTILEILGLCIGLLYLWWEYHADSKVWLASVVMPAISMWIYYSKGLYADFGINIYYLLIAVYGFISWTKKTPSHNNDSGESTEKGSVRQITRTPVSTGVSLIFVAAMLWWGLWWLLVTFTDSTVPVADAFTTALSIVGLWMMARKYVEQWLVWFVVDIVCCGLYLYKGLYFYCGLYGIYTIISLFGYNKWLKMMKDQLIQRQNKS